LEQGSTTVTTGGKRRRRSRFESNPLLVKELRGRMRGARAFVVLTVYLLLLSCFTSIIYYTYVAGAGVGSGPDMAYLGKAIFSSVVIIEIFMVTFITPAFTAGAISGERERKTYELLRTTLLSAHGLVFGKLSSALTYMLLLIMAAVPLESLAFVLGGVVVQELAVALIVLLVTAFAFAVIGILFSAFVRTTLASTVLSYIVALMVTVGLPVLMLVAVALVEPMRYNLDSLNWIVEAALTVLLFILLSLSPMSAAVLTEVFLEQENTMWFFWYTVDSTHRIPILSPWITYAAIYLALALVLLLITILRVRQQERR
jgi:ABC-2 type transport system permease protein